MSTQPRTGFKRVEPPRKHEPKPPKPEGAEPTDEQLCNLACAAGYPLLATPMFRSMPHWRESLLNLHALYQRAVCGDLQAAETIQRLAEAFGRPVLPEETP